MHSTLRHFLTVSLDPHSDKSALVLAVEQDPAILVAVLTAEPRSAANLATWHEYVETSLLRAIAIAMSNAEVVRRMLPEARIALSCDALKQSLLADALARYIRDASVAESRAVALLSGIGQWLAQEEDVAAADAAAANYLSDLGCHGGIGDAVRYRREPVEQLHGTPIVLRINAVSTALAGYVGGPQVVPSKLLADYGALTGLEENDIYEALGRAGRALELALGDLGETPATQHIGPDDFLAELAANASTGAVFYRALIKTGEQRPWRELIDQVGRFLFGFTGLCHFAPQEDGSLATELNGERIEIDESRLESHIARCQREQRITVATRLRAVDLFERQLLRRFGADHLLCLPMNGVGVLVCGIDQRFAENVDRHTVLLSAFADAAADLRRRGSNEGVEVISLDELNKRVREITHEVNNPLAIVQNYLRTLSIKLGNDSPGQKEIDSISREINRVGSIVQKYARIGKSEQLAFRRVDLNSMIEDLLTIVSGGLEGLSIEKRLDPFIPDMELPADALRQVVLNLLKNAVEALHDTADATISVSTQGAVNVGGKHYVEIIVSDNGPGMSHEQRLELFNISRSTKGEGRGLGLGIVAQLIEAMSAIITCRQNTSIPNGSGTSFQILLPMEQK